MWAKIVNNEIMQLHDEDPSSLWHPDAIAENDLPGYWKEVPDHVHIGWIFRDNEWISGSQWHEEWVAKNPSPPPGPPSGSISAYNVELTSTEAVFEFTSNAFGIFTDLNWDVDGESIDENRENDEMPVPFRRTFERADNEQVKNVSLTISGPGGSVVVSTTITVPPVVVIPK